MIYSVRKDRLDIIYEDKNMIVVNKPTNLLTIATAKEKDRTLFHQVIEYEKKKHKSNKVFVVHRLDKDTSGVVVFAKNMKYKNLLQNDWDKLTKNREYIAIVEGIVQDKSKIIKTWLKETKNFVVYSSNKPNDGKLAITKYNLISTSKNCSLLKIQILTGRKNQIRVHMKELGNPIIGDLKYGSTINPIKRMGLHASKLELFDPITNELMIFKAKIPLEFYKIFSIKEFTN